MIRIRLTASAGMDMPDRIISPNPGFIFARGIFLSEAGGLPIFVGMDMEGTGILFHCTDSKKHSLG